MTYTGRDILAWSAHEASQTLNWALDSLSGNGVDTEQDEFEAMDASRRHLESAARLVETYSDGRPVKSQAWVGDQEILVSHLWDYRPSNKGEHLLYTSKRPADPGEDNGSYSVYANPSTCTLRIELTDPAPRLHSIKGGVA